MTFPLSSQGLLGKGLDIKDLERLWLECACAYEVFDDPLMDDLEWDAIGIELNERHKELSPYFTWAVSRCWPLPEPEPGENQLKTASGIVWTDDLPSIIAEGLRRERPVRVALWQNRIAKLRHPS